MASDEARGPDEDAGLRWLLRTPDPIVCAMLAAGPLPRDAMVRAWREAAMRSETDEPYPGEDQVCASLERLTAAGYVAQTLGGYALTESGAELADQVDTLYRALDGNVSDDADDGTSS